MNSLGPIIPGAAYYLNPTTKQMELTDKTIDFDAIMITAQEQLEELKKNPVGKNTLTDAEIQELAQKYDPQKMTQKEYDSFIRYLEEKGVLSKLETCDIGMSFTRIIPGYNGMTVFVEPASTQWVNTLADMNGNALQFVQAKSQLHGLGYNGQIQQGAYSKVLDILNQMNEVREESASSQTSPVVGNHLSNFQQSIDHVKRERIQTV